MKKVLLSIISITAFCFGVRSQNVNIPDANFKDYLLNNKLINKNNDEEIQFSEAAEFAGTIDVSKKKISDLTGIEEFTKLTVLKCHDNPLTTLNVSNNTALTELYCNDNLLTTLDVSKNTALTVLHCYHNKLTTLDVSNNEKLTQLWCFGNQLTTLVVSKNTALTELYCPVYIPDENFKNYLVGDVSINLNEDDEIQFSEAANFTGTIDVSNKKISDLTGIEAFTNLTVLKCNKNKLKTLDVSNNKKLTKLYCQNNDLTTLNVSNENNNSLSDFNATENPNLTCIQVDDYSDSKDSWKIDSDASFSEDCTAVVNIPDANFKNYLLNNVSINLNEDGEIQFSEAAQFTGTIYVSNMHISDLTGIEAFTALTALHCDGNKLKTLDVSKNTALTTLYCDGNKLETLNVSNTALTGLWCRNNLLTTLDVSNNEKLYGLYCNNNDLTTLNVSNKLVNLDATGNSNLTCIQVDDYSDSKDSWKIDLGVSFREDCTVDVSVTSPNGGETFEIGAEVLIEFETKGMTGTRVIEIGWTTDDGITFELIKSGFSADISQSTYWSIDNSVAPGTEYKIVVRTKDLSVSDISDTSFTIEAAPAEVTFTTLSVSGGTVEPNDKNVLIYSFQMDVSGNTAMISGFYVTLNEESDENDFTDTSFELLVGSDANIDNATSLGFTGFGGEAPIPEHGIGWSLEEEYAEGSTTVFFIRAVAFNAPVDGSSFHVAKPTEENFVFEGNETKIVTELKKGSDFTFTGSAVVVSVTSPNGGETFEIGAEVLIEFETKGMTGTRVIEIGWTTDDGITFELINSGPSADISQRIYWSIDNSVAPGTEYKIVVRTKDLSVSDISDTSFTIEAAPAEVTFTTLSVSGGTVEPNDENVLIYSFQMDVSGNTAMISGFYVTLNEESDENDFTDRSFELLVGSDANIDNATPLRYTGFGGEAPIPEHGIGWSLEEEYAEGSTTVFFIRAGAFNAPVDGSSFHVAKPTEENFVFEGNETKIVTGLKKGSDFTFTGSTVDVSAPSDQASIITVTPSYESASAELERGNGSGRIVALKNGSGGFPTVEDGVTYIAGNSLGNGWEVIEILTTQSLFEIKSGLEEESYYSLAVIEFNGSGVDIMYNETFNDNNPKTFSTPNRPSMALDFDGEDDRLVIPYGVNLSLGKTFSLEAYVKPSDQKKGIGVIMQKGSSEATTNFRLTVDSGKDVSMTIINNSQELTTTVRDVFTKDEDVWRLISVSYNGTALKLYIDGSLASEVARTLGTITNLEEPVIVGMNPSGIEPFKGQMDEVRLWTNVQTAGDITQNAGDELTGEEFGLVAYYSFDRATPEELGELEGDEDNTRFTAIANEAVVSADQNLNPTIKRFGLKDDTSNFVKSGVFKSAPEAPTEQASKIESSDITTEGVKITWEKGNGGRRVVLISQINSGELTIENGTFYVGDANFKDGDLVGNGWYTVYNGSAENSVEVTGLLDGEEYRVAVVEVNGAAGFDTYNQELHEDKNIINFTTLRISSSLVITSETISTPFNIRQSKTDNMIYKIKISVSEADVELQGMFLTRGGDAKLSDFDGFRLYASRYIDETPDVDEVSPLKLTTEPDDNSDGILRFTFKTPYYMAAGSDYYFYLYTDINTKATADATFRIIKPKPSKPSLADYGFQISTNDAKYIADDLEDGDEFTIREMPEITMTSGTTLGVLKKAINPDFLDSWVYRWEVTSTADFTLTNIDLPYLGTLFPSDVKDNGAKVFYDPDDSNLPSGAGITELAIGQFGALGVSFSMNKTFEAGKHVFWFRLDLESTADLNKTFQALPKATNMTFSDVMFLTDNLAEGLEHVITKPDIYCNPEPEDPSQITVTPKIELVEIFDDNARLLMTNDSGSDTNFYTNYSETSEVALVANSTSALVVKVDDPVGARLRVWIDWENDGNNNFTGVGEVVHNALFDQMDGNLEADTVYLVAPITVVDFTRLRISVDKNHGLESNGCLAKGNSVNGQVEDYGLSVMADENATRALPASQVGYFSFKAHWGSQVDKQFYRVDVATDEGFHNLIVEDKAVIDTSLVVNDLLYDKNYYYRVRVVYPQGTAENSNTVKVRTLRDLLTAQDSVALRIIYDANGGSNWSEPVENWFKTGVRLTEWEGIEMDGTRISSVDLSGYGLTGKFPEQFGHDEALKEMTTLNLSGNHLTDLGIVEHFAVLDDAALTNLEIQDNKLRFDDLEPFFNAKVARIDNMTYHPQQAIGVIGKSDTISRGDRLTVRFYDITADAYQWTRTKILETDRDSIYNTDTHPGPGQDIGKILYEGAETNVLVIKDVNFESMGDFSVHMTDEDIPNFYLESEPHKVLAFGGVQLNVADLNGLPLDEGTGYLLKIELPGQPFDSLKKDGVPGFPFIDGDLFFDITILGDYIIGVTADPLLYLPTYMPQTFLWEDADTLEFRNTSLVADLTMTAIPEELDPTDEGRIFGLLEVEVPDEEARTEGRRRAKKVRCHVRRNTGSGRDEQEATYTLIASVETNDDGSFDIPFLPDGVYRINFEYPGVPMDQNSFVEFEVGGTSEDLSVQLAALVQQTGMISVEEMQPVGVTRLFNELRIYPNPVANLLNMEYTELESSDVMMYVMDMNGRMIMKQPLPKATRHTHEINVSGFDEGMYFIRLRDESNMEIVRTFKVLIKK